MKKKLLILLVIIIVAMAAFFFLRRDTKKDAGVTNSPEPVAATRGPISLTVVTNGRVVSNLDVEIKCKASGEIVKLPFDISDLVKKGELLMELDPVDEQRNVKQARVSLESSEARLVIAKCSLEIAERNLGTERRRANASLDAAKARASDARTKASRVKDLFERKLASAEELDTVTTSAVQAAADEELAKVKLDELSTQERSLELARQEVQLAEGTVETDKIDLDTVLQRLKDTRVESPLDGIVTLRPVQTGQIISSGISNVGGGTTAMTMSDLSRIFVLAAVDESDIGNVALDQPVNITVDAFPGKRFPGRVMRIATKGLNNNNVVTFEVKIEVLSDFKALLKPEMTANIEIVAAKKDNAVLVPVESVMRKKGQQVVTIVDGINRVERPVETGLTDGVKVEILSGVNDGDKVAVYQSDSNSRWRGGQPSMSRMMGGGGRH